MQNDYIYIILADDDQDDRLFFTDAFDELKIKTRVVTFKDGVELMNYLNKENTLLPNVLFLDLNMPKKTGIECLNEIKANSKMSEIAIVIYSTSASEEDIEKTFVLGANIYIKKPDSFKKLKQVLSEVISINWQYHTNSLNRDNFLLRR